MTADDFAAITVRPGHEGTQLKLGDIARISKTLREQDKLVRSDGMQAMEIIIWPKNQVGATVNAVNEVIDTFRSSCQLVLRS